jgi:pyrrolidone-carboxylate peptidase
VCVERVARNAASATARDNRGAVGAVATGGPDGLTNAVFIHLPATPEQSPPRASMRRLPTIDAVRGLRAAVQVFLAAAPALAVADLTNVVLGDKDAACKGRRRKTEACGRNAPR